MKVFTIITVFSVVKLNLATSCHSLICQTLIINSDRMRNVNARHFFLL